MKRALLALAVLLSALTWIWTRPPVESSAPHKRPAPPLQRLAVEPSESPLTLEVQAESSREAQATPTPANHQQPAALVFGRVTKGGQDPAPFPGASVRLVLEQGFDPQQLAETRSARDGSYSFPREVLPELSPLTRPTLDLFVEARATGLQPATRIVELVELDAGPVQLDLELTEGPTLWGRVLEPSGRPAAQAYVQLLVVLGERSSSSVQVQTDEQGGFVIALGPHAPGLLNAWKRGFLPAILDLSNRDIEQQPDLGELVLGSGDSIAGRVLCADGSPVPGVRVLIPEAVPPIKTAQLGISFNSLKLTDAEGNFVLEGLSGEEFEIEIENQSYGPFPAGSQAVELLYPGRALHISVRDDEGWPLGDVDLQADQGYLEAGSFEVQAYERQRLSPDNGDALFLLDDANAVMLKVELSESYIPQRLFPLDGQACLQEIEWVLPTKPPMGQIEVSLHDPGGKPLAEYYLELLSVIDGDWLYDFYAPGPHMIPAGRYRADLSCPDRRGEYDLPLRLVPFEVLEGGLVRIDEQLSLGGRVSVAALASEDPETITGSILGHYTGADGVRRQMQYHSKRGAPGLLISNEVLPPGAYLFEADEEGYEPISESLRVITGKTTQLQQPLQAALE